MKKLSVFFSKFALLGGLLLALAACNKTENDPTPQDLILGSWRGTNYTVSTFLRDVKQTEERKPLTGASLLFQANGQGTEVYDGQTYTLRRWVLSSDGKSLETENTQGEIYDYDVRKLTSTELTLWLTYTEVRDGNTYQIEELLEYTR